MKRRGLYFATILAACLVARSVSAQHEHHGMTHHLTASEAKLDVQDDPSAQVLTVRLGSVNLPAHSDHHSVAQPPNSTLTIPFDGWLVAYHPRIVSDTGEKLPGRLIHHVAFYNTARSDFLCPKKEEHIFGAGGEMNDWPALPGFGYRVARGDIVRIGTMWHNPTDQSHPNAFLEVKVEYKRADSGAELKSVYPTWFDVQECGNSGYDLKPGKNVNAGKLTLGYAGTLLGVGGHLHDYGQQLVAENLTRKEEIAALNSKLDPAGRILGMPIVTFTNRGGYRLNKGEVIKVTATYENTTGKPLPEGAMGIVVGYFLPDNDTEMAALKRNNNARKTTKNIVAGSE